MFIIIRRVVPALENPKSESYVRSMPDAYLYVCKHVCMHVCMYVCIHVRMHVCMYVRMHVFMCDVCRYLLTSKLPTHNVAITAFSAKPRPKLSQSSICTRIAPLSTSTSLIFIQKALKLVLHFTKSKSIEENYKM